MNQVVWFKRDLRTTDHRPLAEAARRGPVLPLYVVEPDYWRLPDASRRQWAAIRAALAELDARLTVLGAPLIVRTGSVVEVLEKIHRSVGVSRLLAHQETGNGWTFARDRAVLRFCAAEGIDIQEFNQDGVVRRLADRDGWARAHAAMLNAPIAPEPARLTPVAGARPAPLPTAEDLALAPDGCDAPQPGTRAEALRLFDSFLAGRGAGYRREMSSPLAGALACSRLSTALSTGAVSIREIHRRTRSARDALGDLPPAARPIPLGALDSLISRLHWRGHFIQKLESEPALEFRALHPAHERARRTTPDDDPTLEAWGEGRTGYPFLDACLRSLIATGWLNFRMRAMVQAFASYHLGLDWRASGARLAALFTDYEPGIHWPQVQMQSGQTGINTPRIYNPVKQGLDQDPTGAFIRRWIPELRDAPLAGLHQPWRLDAARRGAYPEPILDHEAAARAARARLTAIRADPDYRRDAQAVFLRHGSRKRRIDQDHPAADAARAQAQARAAARQLSFDF